MGTVPVKQVLVPVPIGTPESRQTWVRRIAGRTIVCSESDRDRHRRIVEVRKASAEDVNAWIVSEGLPLAYRKYSTSCVGQERAAKAARRGLWRGEFVAPWDWPWGKPLAAAAPAARAGECRIKGNISRSGTRIYHGPGAQHYDRTRIDTSKGEREFCSEAEARAAGAAVNQTLSAPSHVIRPPPSVRFSFGERRRNLELRYVESMASSLRRTRQEIGVEYGDVAG